MAGTGRRVWLLDLDVDGVVHRYSTEPVEVTADDGAVYRYGVGLRPLTVVWRSELTTIGVSVDDPTADWLRVVGRGGTLDNLACTLRRWEPGQTLEQAQRVIVGITVDPEWGSPGSDTLTLSIQSEHTRGGRLYPDAYAVVDAGTFDMADPLPRADYAAAGAVYPTPIGYPGSGDAPETTAFPASDCLMPKFTGVGGPSGSRIELSVGRLHATQVTLWDVDAADYATAGSALSQTRTVLTDTDLLGRLYSYVVLDLFGGGTGLEPWEGHRYLAGYNNDPADGGGILGPDGATALRGLGDVIVWLLEQGGATIDRPRAESERAALNRYSVDTTILERIDPVRFIDDALAKMFPILRVLTGDGLHYRLIDYTATAIDSAHRLDVPAGEAVALGSLSINRADLANVFEVNFAKNPVTSKYYGRRTLQAEHAKIPFGTGATDDRVLGSALCAASQARYGRIEAMPIHLDHSWSVSSAVLLLAQLAASRCFPLVRATYTARRREDLIPGDTVVVHDPARHISERPARVLSVTLGPEVTRVAVELLTPRTVDTT